MAEAIAASTTAPSHQRTARGRDSGARSEDGAALGARARGTRNVGSRRGSATWTVAVGSGAERPGVSVFAGRYARVGCDPRARACAGAAAFQGSRARSVKTTPAIGAEARSSVYDGWREVKEP